MEKAKEYCQRILVKNINGPGTICLFGLILSESDKFITIQTRKKTYTFSKSLILEISDTGVEFNNGTKNIVNRNERQEFVGGLG